MHKLFADFDFPWYFYVIAGIFIVLLIGHKGVRTEFDAFLAHCFGLNKTKERTKGE